VPSIEFDRHGAPITVAQIICPTHLTCSYVVSCGRTHATAIIDPEPCVDEDIAVHVAEHGLLVRFILKTRAAGEQRAENTSSRYASMLASLGLEVVAPSAQVAERWAGIPVICPLPASENTAPEDQVCVDAAGAIVMADVGIADATAAAAHRVTVSGPNARPTQNAHAALLRIAIGSFHVRVLPIAPGHIAYDVMDRVFSGSALRADDEAEDTTSDVLLDLADHTIVYPSYATGTVSISIIAQEARLGMTLFED